MILGVLSDTHGNLGLMLRAAETARAVLGAAHLVHLGDDWEDQEALAHAGYAVSGVPGLWCDAYSRPAIPKARVDVFDGLTIAYAHFDRDLPPLASDVGLVLAGHTHRAEIGRYKGRPYLNPGHLKQPKDRGRPATFGLITIEPEALHLAIHDLAGKVLQTKTHARAHLAGGRPS